MSQNDYTIANQGFPAFRADLNTALQALATNNSGATAPSTTFANMWWYETDTNILYIRNEDNDAWIKFAELDQVNDKFILSGTLQLDDGTVSAPALTFNSDTNMGLYRGGTDILRFVTAGTDRVTILANGDTGIGTSSPSSILHLSSALPILSFTDTDDSATSRVYQDSESFVIDVDNANAKASSLFKVHIDNTERMRIDSAGRLLLGTTTEGEATGDDLTIATTGPTGITIRSGTSSDGHIFFSDGTSGADEYRGYLQYNHQNNRLSFATDAVERMRIDSQGHLLVGTTTTNGDASNGKAVVSGRFTTQADNTATTSGVATTLMTFGQNEGNFLVSARLSGTGNASTDNTTGIVHINGSTSTYTALVAGSRVVLSMSGLNLQGRQTLFTGANIGWNVIKISF